MSRVWMIYVGRFVLELRSENREGLGYSSFIVSMWYFL
jgi:hypothetical protein